MSITFAPAARTAAPLAIGVAGPPGSGKTVSALRIATGLADGGPIYVIDTENGRALQYADPAWGFRFHHGLLQAPFTAERYLHGLDAAMGQGAKVVVIDSFSHLHEGPGGLLDQHEAELQRMAGSDYGKRERMKFTAWIEPKRRYKNLFLALQALPVHVVYCMRAKDKLMMVKNTSGRSEPVSVGWTPIVPERFDYSLTLSLVLPPNSRGKPNLNAESTKLDERSFAFIKDQEQITEATGRALLDWSRGNARVGAKPRQNPMDHATLDNDVPTEDRALLGARELLRQIRALHTRQAFAALIEDPETVRRLGFLRTGRKDGIAGFYKPAWDVLDRAREEAWRRVAEANSTRQG